MDTVEYQELVALLEAQLKEVGAGELADISLHALRDQETGERRRRPPREHLIEMLLAFDRYLSIRDHNTLSISLRRINNELDDAKVNDVVFVPIPGEGEDTPISFDSAPDLRTVREDVKFLIKQLREESDPTQTVE